MLISDCEARKGGERLLSKPCALIGARQDSVVSEGALLYLLVEGSV